jgi:myo-inositol-1(or 4)-monophosphatase
MASRSSATDLVARKMLPGTRAAVVAIAERVRSAQARLRSQDVRRKGEGDFVTRVDLVSERALRRELEHLLPMAGFLGEESDPHGLASEWLWVVDPIDGTSNFARGLPHFAVSVALLHRGMPVLAVIHCAPEQATYTAVAGGGTRRNGRLCRMAARRLGDASILGCQWQRGQLDLAFLERLQRLGGRIRTFGSTVTQLADVAVGRLDGNVQVQGRIWDIAAAGLVVEQAGGRFTDWSGRRVFPFRDLTVGHTSTVACHGVALPAILRALGG